MENGGKRKKARWKQRQKSCVPGGSSLTRNSSTGNLANNLAILPLLFCRHSISTFLPFPFFFLLPSRRLIRRLVPATFIVNNPLERVGRRIVTRRFCSSFLLVLIETSHTIRVDKLYDFTSERDSWLCICSVE